MIVAAIDSGNPKYQYPLPNRTGISTFFNLLKRTRTTFYLFQLQPSRLTAGKHRNHRLQSPVSLVMSLPRLCSRYSGDRRFPGLDGPCTMDLSISTTELRGDALEPLTEPGAGTWWSLFRRLRIAQQWLFDGWTGSPIKTRSSSSLFDSEYHINQTNLYIKHSIVVSSISPNTFNPFISRNILYYHSIQQ
jgi:hypothetical protein